MTFVSVNFNLSGSQELSIPSLGIEELKVPTGEFATSLIWSLIDNSRTLITRDNDWHSHRYRIASSGLERLAA